MPVIKQSTDYACQYCGCYPYDTIEECEEHERMCYDNPSIHDIRKSYIGKCYHKSNDSGVYLVHILDYHTSGEYRHLFDYESIHIYRFRGGYEAVIRTCDSDSCINHIINDASEVSLERYENIKRECIRDLLRS